MKLFSLVLFYIMLPLGCILAQQVGPNISFEQDNYNFGKIEEVKGPVSYVFNFTNTGNEPLVIQEVTPSCGCTTPEWSKAPVAPGAKGFIKATFNPAGRKGPFTKSIKVVTNSVPQNNVILHFSGEVIGKPLTAEDHFPFKIDNLRFSSLYVAFGKISPGTKTTRKLEIFNAGKDNLPIAFPAIPGHLEVMVDPAIVKPGQKTIIEITYDPAQKNDWGPVSDILEYTVNGKKDSRFKITLTATIADNYTNITPAQLANAPRSALEKNTLEFGHVRSGETIAVRFVLKNNGKSNLLVHKLNAECGCTQVKIKDKTIKPGASTEITGSFSAVGLKGFVNKAITLITNDPQNPNLVLWIRGTID